MTATYARRAAPSAALLLLAAYGCHDGALTEPAAGAPSSAMSNRASWSAPVPLGPTVNSAANELQPALSKDGLTLYFASNRLTSDGDAVADPNIWVSERACTDAASPACAWGAPRLLPEVINTAALETAPSLSRDEHWLYFTTVRDVAGERDIVAAYRADVHDPLGWERVVDLGPNVNSAAAEVAPSYFENDEGGAPQLFFNRGAPGGDIYVSEMAADGTWGPATPVAELNSAASDQRASIKHNGVEIYFWSDRSGRAQIWQATRPSVSDPWSAPTIVPSPIADEQSLHPFIHSHGATETLLFSRIIPGTGLDLYMSTRTRGSAPE